MKFPLHSDSYLALKHADVHIPIPIQILSRPLLLSSCFSSDSFCLLFISPNALILLRVRFDCIVRLMNLE